MAIDPMMLDPVLNTFRNMLQGVLDKNLTGPDVDTLCETMERMEQLGRELSDFNAFNGTIMQENLYGKFSEYYGKVLATEAKEAYTSGEKSYDDASLLKQSIDALKNAIAELERNYKATIELSKGDASEVKVNVAGKKKKFKTAAYDNSVETAILTDPKLIIKGIQDVIDLGEQPGMTLPRFLKLQIESGLDKAMQGTVVARNGQQYTLGFTKAMSVSPYHIAKENKKLDIFDELAAKSKFNVPNTKELSYAHREIDREFDRPIAMWDDITDRWDDLFWDLSFWSLSYCSFARHLEPWSMSDNPKKAIIETQKTTPGIFKQKERLLEKYYDIKFLDIFKHETFKWAVEYNHISYSQEWIEFVIEKIYPECKPFNNLQHQLVEERASFFKKDRTSIDREMNPERHMPAKRMQEFYDSQFGQGRYNSKYGTITVYESGAKPWDWETFKYK